MTGLKIAFTTFSYTGMTEADRVSPLELPTGREVRIHECHSACTMALSLPNVCVYKDSVFKFHQAYDPRNHVTNVQVSDALFSTYPAAVRERLGTLTRKFAILRGAELIDLGIRDCATPPEPRIMVAQATIKPLPETLSGAESGWSALTGRLQGIVPNFGVKPESVLSDDRPLKRAPALVPAESLAPSVPLPPEKPVGIEAARPNSTDDPSPASPDGLPTPPPRPKILIAFVPSLPPIPFMQKIEGSQPILPSRFVPFPKRPT